MRFIKSVALILIAVLMMGTMTACDGGSGEPRVPLVTGDVEDSQSVLKTLNQADVIFAKKKMFSLNDVWVINADDVEVGTVEGRFLSHSICKPLAHFCFIFS